MNKDTFYADIFEDGKFISRVTLDLMREATQLASGMYFFFVNGQLLVNDIFEEKLIIYDYEFK